MKRLINLILICAVILASQPLALAGGFNNVFMQGFSLEKITGNQKIYCIRAQEARLTNKRVAFLNISLIKVIDLKGVDLELYTDGKMTSQQHFDKAVFEITTRRLLDANGRLIFKE